MSPIRFSLVGCSIVERPRLTRWRSKYRFMERDVIFPRVHVPRNEGRLDRQAEHLVMMLVEQRAQAAPRIEVEQFVTVCEID